MKLTDYHPTARLSCGHRAPADTFRFTSAQVFAAHTMGEDLTSNLLVTCPHGCGLVDVVKDVAK